MTVIILVGIITMQLPWIPCQSKMLLVTN